MTTSTAHAQPGLPAPPAAGRTDPGRTGARAGTQARWWWLLAGLLLLLAAQHGHPDVGVAAWVHGVFLLRYTRHTSLLRGSLAMLAVHSIAGAVWAVSIRLPGDGIPWAAVVGCVALNAALVLPFVLDRLITPRLRSATLSTLVYPSARVAVELAIAAVSPFGIVFGFLAATQHDQLPLLQVASVTGLYGVSFLVAWAAPALVELWEAPSRWKAPAVFVSVTLVVVAGGSLTMWAFAPSSPTVRVAGVTPSAEVEKQVNDLPGAEEVAAGSPAELQRTMEPVTAELLESTEREAAAGAEIIVWSEAATRAHETDAARLYERVGEIARRHDVHIQVGAALYTADAPHGRNIATLIGPDGSVVWEYDKAHPLAGLEPIEASTNEVPTVRTRHGVLAGMICYDIDYATARVDSDILMLPAADWEGFTPHHSQKAQLRAIENGYSIVRQDAYGSAVAYDVQGRALAEVDYFRTDQQTLVAQVPTQGRPTVYSAVGDVFAWTCVAALAALGLLALARRVRP